MTAPSEGLSLYAMLWRVYDVVELIEEDGKEDWEEGWDDGGIDGKEGWEEVAMMVLMILKRTGKKDATMVVMMVERLEQ